MAARLGAIFSDVDGTIVHYVKKLEQHLGYVYLGPIDPPRVHDLSQEAIHAFRHVESGQVVEAVPVPSATLGGGFCSLETLRLCAELRQRGVMIVLITGARESTFTQRVMSRTIPAADYAACEGGGRLWGPDHVHDDAWTDRFAFVCGPWREQQELPCELKVGLLWDAYRLLARDDALGPGTGSLKLDGRNFTTAFMVDIREDTTKDVALGVETVSAKERRLRDLTATLLEPQLRTCMVVNLGKAHFAPIGVDKRTVVEYIAERTGITINRTWGEEEEGSVAREGDTAAAAAPTRVAAALFDDENDLSFAGVCALGFAPSIAHPSVVTAMAALGPHFERVPVEGFLGTEYALQRLLALVSP